MTTKNSLAVIAQNVGTTPEEIKDVLSGMIISAKAQHNAKATDAELAVVSGVCAKFGLNPLVREAHAFISGGKLQVMIGLDGWIRIMLRQKNYDGHEQIDNFNEKGELVSVTTKIYVKDRSHPTCVTEYMDECYQEKSSAWKGYKKRMLHGKSLGQAVRVAFGVSELIDDDEAARITSSRQEKDITPQQPAIDWTAINDQMAECGDLDTLKQVAGSLRREMEINGTWASNKDHMILLHAEHKERIEKAYSQQFEPVVDGSDGSVVDAEYTDVGFGDGE